MFQLDIAIDNLRAAVNGYIGGYYYGKETIDEEN